MAPRLLLAGLLALAAAACGTDEHKREPSKPKFSAEAQQALDELSANSRTPDDAGDIAQLLSERAQALEEADILALSATATGRQRARDRISARRVKRLEIERIRMVVNDLQTSEDRAEAKVAMSYRIGGMRRPFRTLRKLSLRDLSVGWRVSREVAAAEAVPWEAGAYAATRSRHVVLLAPEDFDASELRPGLERAYRDIRRDLPRRDLPRSVLVIAARDEAETERLTGRIARDVIALANVTASWGRGPAYPVRRVLSQRMIVVLSRWRALPASERRMTLVHEMTHTALNPDTSARTPAWLVEGAAMYVSDEDRVAEARARAAAGDDISLARISKPDVIFGMNAREQGAAYAASSAAAYAIVERRGAEGLFRFYDRFNDQKIFGRPGARLTDRVLRRSLDMSLAEVQAAVDGR